MIIFDLDGTLTESKSAITGEMAKLLIKLLKNYQVCVISGGKFEQFEQQLLANLNASPEILEKLHIMPTCGTRYFTYDIDDKKWQMNYAEYFSDSEKKQIIKALESGIDELNLREPKPWGDLIEDRGSQITFSALGQKAPVVVKETWDPDGVKKNALREIVAAKIPEFEVHAGGLTSIDITKSGMDKGFGITRLSEMTGINLDEMLFIGDHLEKSGNDYSVKALGIDSMSVKNWHDTALIIETLLSSINVNK